MNSEKEFSIWLSNTDKYINDFYEYFSKEYSGKLKLDYSLRSLYDLEEFMLKNQRAFSLEDDGSIFYQDGIVAYIGKTILKNIRGTKWYISLKDGDLYYGQPSIKAKYTTIPIYVMLIRIVHNKTGTVLKDWIEGIISHEKSIDSALALQKERENDFVPPQHNGYSYQYFLFKEDIVSVFDELEEHLKKYLRQNKNILITGYQKHIVLTLSNHYHFHLELINEDYVKVEYKEMCEDKGIMPAKNINARIELWGDEDPDYKYVNKASLLIEILKKIDFIFYDISTGELNS